MSLWADLAGDDSNVSMAADEFVDLRNMNVFSDISNSASHNRSRLDPELDNSKQGLNLQLKQFGLGSNSNSGLGKKRPRSEMQDDGDQDEPPKSKQRTTGPQDFSHFLDSSSTRSSLNLSNTSSSCRTTMTNNSSVGTIPSTTSTPSENNENQPPEGLYAAVIGSKPRASRQKSLSPDVPELTSQPSTTTTTEPSSASSVKINRSLPSSVRRRRLMRRRVGKPKQQKSASSPPKNEVSSPNTKNEEEDVEMEIAPVEDVQVEIVEEEVSDQPNNASEMEMDVKDKSAGEDLEPGHTVVNTWGNGKIFIPSDIIETAKKKASVPMPSPFRLVRNASTSKSTSPQKLTFTSKDPTPPVFIPPATLPAVPFNLSTFMPLPIPAPFGLSSSVSPKNGSEGNDQNEMSVDAPVPDIPAQPILAPPALFPFVPMVPSVVQSQLPGTPGTTTNGSTNSPLPFNFTMPILPMQFPVIPNDQLPATSSPINQNPPPVFIPFQMPCNMMPTIQSNGFALNSPNGTVPKGPLGAPLINPFNFINSPSGLPPPNPQPPQVIQQPIESKVEKQSDEEEAKVTIPKNSVWAAPQSDDEQEENSWRTKCFKEEVARNKVLKVREQAKKVEQRKAEMRLKQREKELLPLDRPPPVKVTSSKPYGIDKPSKTWRKEYHPYKSSGDRGPPGSGRGKGFRRMRGRARSRSTSQGRFESPQKSCEKDKGFWRKADSMSQSGSSPTSPSHGQRSTSTSVEARDLPHQDPQELTEEMIAWRLKQIEIAKNTDGYRNYLRKLPKSQRRKHHPQTPNAKARIAKRRWVGKYNKWRKQLHEYDYDDDCDQVEGLTEDTGSGVTEETPSLQSQTPSTIENVPPPPSSAGDVDECLMVALQSLQDSCEGEDVELDEPTEPMDVDVAMNVCDM